MICCDRCEEWFHGDCVGITEARGRLMERNGEDYICPNCTARKSQVLRPATGALATGLAAGKAKAPVETPRPEPGSAVSHQATASSMPGGGAAEEKLGDDPGIKGRIEKATNPTGKKKIKIFQPVGSGDGRVNGRVSTAMVPAQLNSTVLSFLVFHCAKVGTSYPKPFWYSGDTARWRENDANY